VREVPYVTKTEIWVLMLPILTGVPKLLNRGPKLFGGGS
jgi:hypothetical protein